VRTEETEEKFSLLSVLCVVFNSVLSVVAAFNSDGNTETTEDTEVCTEETEKSEVTIYHSFNAVFQMHYIEVYQQSQLEIPQLQISKRLSEMNVVERLH